MRFLTMVPGAIALALPLMAGEIFGDIRVGSTYAAQAPLQLVCGTDTVRSRTDSLGSFRLSNRTGGKCDLTVTWEKANATVQVVVFEKPARYRLVLEQKEGTWILKRV